MSAIPGVAVAYSHFEEIFNLVINFLKKINYLI